MFLHPIRRLQSDQLWSSSQAATLRKNEGVINFNGILCKKGKESIKQTE